MFTLLAILGWMLFGLIAGALARLFVPGRQPLGMLGTMVLGVLGSFAGGFLTWLLLGGDPVQPAGFMMSVVGAVIVLAIYVRASSRSRNGYRV